MPRPYLNGCFTLRLVVYVSWNLVGGSFQDKTWSDKASTVLETGITDHPELAHIEAQAIAAGIHFGERFDIDENARAGHDQGSHGNIQSTSLSSRPYLGWDRVLRGHCSLDTLSGKTLILPSGDIVPDSPHLGVLHNDTIVIILLRDADSSFTTNAWNDSFRPLLDLVVRCDQKLGQTDACRAVYPEIHFVWLNYDRERSKSNDIILTMRDRLHREAYHTVDNSTNAMRVVEDRFHFARTSAWDFSSETCKLPSILQGLSTRRGRLSVFSSAIDLMMRKVTTGTRGTWARTWSNGNARDVVGPLRWFGLSCGDARDDPLDWPRPEHDIRGTVALIARGRCSFYQKAKRAQLAGATAAIVFSTDDDPIAMACSAPDDCEDSLNISVVMIGLTHGELLLASIYPWWLHSERTNASLSTHDLVAHLEGVVQGPPFLGVMGQTGSLHYLGRAAESEGLTSIASEVKGMRYQHQILKRRTELAKQSLEEVSIVEVVKAEDMRRGSLKIPYRSDVRSVISTGRFDQLEIELVLDCLTGPCGPWDFEMNLYVCQQHFTSHPTDCRDSHAILGRWITAYGRKGRWLSNNTAALAVLAALSDGDATLHLRCSGWQQYKVTLSFFLQRSTTKSLARRGPALDRIKLWEGGRFDKDYNLKHPVLKFHAPEGTEKAILAVMLTGHGWGRDTANCAEFCNHSHHFSVNDGAEIVRAFPLAGTTTGCKDLIDSGVIPNQYGTWYFGRAGWCPGKHVDWWEVDVTHLLSRNSARMNIISYYSLFNGSNYIPEQTPNGNDLGFAAEIHLSSFLTFYARAGDNVPQDVLLP